jgi:hypothetical protein
MRAPEQQSASQSHSGDSESHGPAPSPGVRGQVSVWVRFVGDEQNVTDVGYTQADNGPGRRRLLTLGPSSSRQHRFSRPEHFEYRGHEYAASPVSSTPASAHGACAVRRVAFNLYLAHVVRSVFEIGDSSHLHGQDDAMPAAGGSGLRALAASAARSSASRPARCRAAAAS